MIQRGATIYNQLCFACHGKNGEGQLQEGASAAATLAPALLRSARVIGDEDRLIAVLLKGLTGPVNGKSYNSVMMPLENNDDEWIASIATYIRNGFGNRASFITTNDVARVRGLLAHRREPWTEGELMQMLLLSPLPSAK